MAWSLIFSDKLSTPASRNTWHKTETRLSHPSPSSPLADFTELVPRPLKVINEAVVLVDGLEIFLVLLVVIEKIIVVKIVMFHHFASFTITKANPFSAKYQGCPSPRHISSTFQPCQSC